MDYFRNSIGLVESTCETRGGERRTTRADTCGRLDLNPKESAIHDPTVLQQQGTEQAINLGEEVEWGAAVQGTICR